MSSHTHWAGGAAPYDPDRRLEVRWADVVGARNAVAQLLNTLTDSRTPPSEYRVMSGINELPAGVFPDRQDHFEDLDQVVDWLTGLRDRLKDDLPWPDPDADE